MSPTSAFVLGGTASGVGKTTLAMGLLAALRARGVAVQPFKAGPDYIDPTFLTRAAGRACRNLDTWMLPHEAVRELFWRAASSAQAALVEGVMGLFDGRSGTNEEGSAAHLSKLLGLPVVLVVDARAMARSAAAVVLGYRDLDPDVRLTGVILNRVASDAHAAMCREAIETLTGVPVLGALRRSDEITIPERHLGLVPEVERALDDTFLAQLASTVERQVDIDALLARCQVELQAPAEAGGLFSAPPSLSRARIAIARDEAFHFYYEDSLDLLTAWGAELLPFSPLRDRALPLDADGVYIGGGFPEVAAAELSANRPMLDALRAAAAQGTPIYGECGGLMYLGRSLTTADGAGHEMVGAIEAESYMGDRLALGYREVRATGSPFMPRGVTVRVHEFHWSQLRARPSAERAAYEVVGNEEVRPEGYSAGSVTATYMHMHAAAHPDLARHFVKAMAGAR